MHAEKAAVEFVGAGLRRYSHRSAAGNPLLSIEVIGGDVDRLDALHRRNIDRVVRHRDQDIGRTVHSSIIGAAVLAVDVGGQGTPRRIDDGIL